LFSKKMKEIKNKEGGEDIFEKIQGFPSGEKGGERFFLYQKKRCGGGEGKEFYSTGERRKRSKGTASSKEKQQPTRGGRGRGELVRLRGKLKKSF